MMTTNEVTVKTRKRKAAKTQSVEASKPGRRVNLKLSDDAYERLVIQSMKTREDPGKIVEALINTYVTEWNLPARRGVRSASVIQATHEDRTSLADPVMETASV